MKALFLLFSLLTSIFLLADAQEHTAGAAAPVTAVIMAASLDDSVLAAQVLMTGIDGRGSLSPAMRNALERIPVGGVMLFRYNLDSSKEDVKLLLSETVEIVTGITGIEPFMAVDHEGGTVHRFGPGVERMPSALYFWEIAQRTDWDAALDLAQTVYSHSAREIRELGVTMVLAPVVEILDEENKNFLGTRSYGPDPDFVQAAASVFIKSMEAAGIVCVLKHFPGNSAADPHYAFSTLNSDRQTLDEMIKPFAGIISDLKSPSVMLSHVLVTAIDENRNASLSHIVIEGWLRGELGFQGIAIADDYAMDAVAALGLSPAAAAVQALKAGIDMIMVWPRDLVAVHTAILKALEDGHLPRERLEEAATRIIVEKIRFGISNEKLEVRNFK